jgi:DegV family protein with EDD domain
LARLRDEGKTVDEAAEWAKDNVANLCHYFTVDDLGHLKRGGRISGFSMIIGKILKIKPLLSVNGEGKLFGVKKCVGRAKAFVSLIEKIKQFSDKRTTRVHIVHADCPEDAKKIAARITAEFGITDIYINYVGPIIGTHTGPGAMGVGFIGKGRES